MLRAISDEDTSFDVMPETLMAVPVNNVDCMTLSLTCSVALVSKAPVTAAKEQSVNVDPTTSLSPNAFNDTHDADCVTETSTRMTSETPRPSTPESENPLMSTLAIDRKSTRL